LRTHLQLRI